MWDKNFRRKIMILHPPPSYPYTFSLPEIFWNTPPKGSSTKCFGTVRQKIFDRKSWHSPSPLIHKLFRCRKLSETQHRRVHLQNFSALWDKKFSTENLDTPPSPLIHKLFRYRKFSERHRRMLQLRNFSAMWDKKFSTENLDTPSSPLLSIHFFATGNFLKHTAEGFLYEMFRYCKTKNFRRKILILPPPLLSIHFFATGNFLKHSTEGFLYEMFRYCKTKNFRRKFVTYPSEP